MSDLLARIDKRLKQLGKTRRAASIEAGLGAEYLRDMERKKTRSPSVENLEKLAGSLQTTVEWLRTGDGDERKSICPDSNETVTVSRWLLNVAAEKVLTATIAAFRPDLPAATQEAIGTTMAAELLATLEAGPIPVPGHSEEAAIQIRFQSEAGKNAQRYLPK